MKEKFKNLKKARELAQKMGYDSIASTDGKPRENVRVLAVNPNMRVTVTHLDVKDMSDILNRCIDSGDYDRNPTTRRRLTAIAASGKLSLEDRKFLEQVAVNDPRIQSALLTTPGSISRGAIPMDITEPVKGFSVRRMMNNSGGSCSIDMVFVDGAEMIAVGDRVTIFLEDDTLFAGKIITIEHTDEHNMRLEAMDVMWYLKNNVAWIQPKRMKLSDAFKDICTSLGIPFVCNVDTMFECPARVEAGATGLGILTAMIEETLYAIGKQFFIRVNPVAVELRDIEGEWKDGKLRQEASKFELVEAVTGFRTQESISGTVANDIRFFTGSANTLALHEVQDIPSIARYGILRYHEVAQNAIVTEQTMEGLLRTLKYPTRDLSIEMVGMVNILPGDVITIAGSVYVASSIVYTYTSDGYNMSVSMAQWQKPDGVRWNFSQKMREEWETYDKVLDIPQIPVDKNIGDLKRAAMLLSRSQTFIADAQRLINSGQLDEASANDLKITISEHQKKLGQLKKAMDSPKGDLTSLINSISNDGFYSKYKKVGGKR